MNEEKSGTEWEGEGLGKWVRVREGGREGEGERGGEGSGLCVV